MSPSFTRRSGDRTRTIEATFDSYVILYDNLHLRGNADGAAAVRNGEPHEQSVRTDQAKRHHRIVARQGARVLDADAPNRTVLPDGPHRDGELSLSR